MRSVPEMPAYNTGENLVVWCSHCRRLHNCGVHAGPATAEMIRDMRRRRQHGLEVAQ